MVEDKVYGITKSWRVDSRFYLVEINKRFYLIDYSDPKDFRNYLVPFFPETISTWSAYDVTQDKEVFTEGKIWTIFEKFKQMIFWFFIFFIINSLFFPKSLRLSQWTANIELAKHWIPIVFCVFGGIFIIILILRLLTNEVQGLQKYPTFRLQTTSTTARSKMNIVLKGIMLSLVTYPTLLIIGIGGNNYIQLFLFGFIGTYCLIFVKFIEFQPIMGRKKMYLEEN